jgi:DNA-directed RNA polymerase specialized sigma24 family protein
MAAEEEGTGTGTGTGSVTHWIDALKAGDPAAAQPLWERYFDRLVRLAGAKLHAAQHARGAEDEEDAALSAFDSFFEGARNGRFPQLADRDDLWRLLVVITARKAWDQLQRQRARKRGGGRVVEASAGSDGDGDGFADLVGSEPTPEFAAMVAEEYARRLEGLPDESYRKIALWKFEGYNSEEIAGRLGCSLRTVANKLKWIRMAWEEGAA